MVNVELAYQIAMGTGKPFMRFCADIMTDPPVPRELYCAIKSSGYVTLEDTNGGKLFFTGPFSAALSHDARTYLDSKRFPYSDARVDGVGKDGSTNLAVWLQRSDIEKTTPPQIREVFEQDMGLVVLERVERFEELPDGVQDFSREAGMRTPITARVLFDGDRDMRGERRYSVLAPHVLHFYGGEAPPEETMRLFDEVLAGNIRIRVDGPEGHQL